MATVNYSDTVELRIAGYTALKEALGVDNAIRFMQECCQGSGDYTKEKYEKPEPSREEIIARIMANRNKTAS